MPGPVTMASTTSTEAEVRESVGLPAEHTPEDQREEQQVSRARSENGNGFHHTNGLSKKLHKIVGDVEGLYTRLKE